jgi:hypothetical protein
MIAMNLTMIVIGMGMVEELGQWVPARVNNVVR